MNNLIIMYHFIILKIMKCRKTGLPMSIGRAPDDDGDDDGDQNMSLV